MLALQRKARRVTLTVAPTVKLLLSTVRGSPWQSCCWLQTAPQLLLALLLQLLGLAAAATPAAEPAARAAAAQLAVVLRLRCAAGVSLWLSCSRLQTQLLLTMLTGTPRHRSLVLVQLLLLQQARALLTRCRLQKL